MGRRIMVPISTRAWIACGLLVAGFLVAWNWQGNRYEARIATMQAAHAEALADAQERARKVEQDWAAAMIEVQKDARNKQADVAVELGSANDELARLREAINKRTDRATRDTSDACRGEAAGSALLLQAELLAACSARVVELAGEADLRRVSGLACEGYGEALQGQ